MSGREWGSLVLLLGGLLFLALTVWLRRGRSRRARSWMYTPLGEMRTERMVIVGFPVCGFGLLALGMVAIPEHAFGLELFDATFHAVSTGAALIVLALLVVPVLYWILVFLPIPDMLYPRWARRVRKDRRQFPQTAPWQPPEVHQRP